jgi:two-component system CheB/CheR fusion protein
MDVQMPGMDGVAATQAIRAEEAAKECKQTTIIALTAHALTGDREQLLAAGFDGYVAKPIDLESLLAEINRLLGDCSRSGQRGVAS